VAHEGEEPKRVLGIPLSGAAGGDRFPPRVLGIPRDWFGPPAVDLRRLAHPRRWWRWRRQVRRLGPYAPDYGDDGATTAAHEALPEQ